LTIANKSQKEISQIPKQRANVGIMLKIHFMAVPTFFVLSNDCITSTAIERSPPIAIWKRIVRVYAAPSFW